MQVDSSSAFWTCSTQGTRQQLLPRDLTNTEPPLSQTCSRRFNTPCDFIPPAIRSCFEEDANGKGLLRRPSGFAFCPFNQILPTTKRWNLQPLLFLIWTAPGHCHVAKKFIFIAFMYAHDSTRRGPFLWHFRCSFSWRDGHGEREEGGIMCLVTHVCMCDCE